MAKQLIYVDDASIGATGDTGIIYDSDAGTLTTTKAISGTALTLDSTITGGAATDIALNTDKFTVDATNGNTVIAGTATITGALTQTGAVACASTLGVAGVFTPAVAVAQPIVNVAATNGAKVIAVDKKLTTYITNATADIAASLADGEDGQELIVILGTKDTNNVVITPAHMANGTTVTLDASAERVHFIFDGTNWHVVSTNGTVA